MIEVAGLKGLRIGGAEVSLQHANFIENTGQATAEDVLALMERIKETISERTEFIWCLRCTFWASGKLGGDTLDKLVIEGGRPLSGTIRIHGAKMRLYLF